MSPDVLARWALEDLGVTKPPPGGEHYSAAELRGGATLRDVVKCAFAHGRELHVQIARRARGRFKKGKRR